MIEEMSILDVCSIRLRELLRLSGKSSSRKRKKALKDRSHNLLLLYLETLEQVERLGYPRVEKN